MLKFSKYSLNLPNAPTTLHLCQQQVANLVIELKTKNRAKYIWASSMKVTCVQFPNVQTINVILLTKVSIIFVGYGILRLLKS